MEDYLFRCSSLGKLMTEPRSKSEVLSETAKSHLIECYIQKKYGIRKDWSNKFVEKGNEVEEQSISLISQLDGKVHFKNETRFKNEFIEGVPDIVEDIIHDTKSSWDIFTFFDAKTSKLDKGYFLQMQGYMWLTGRTEARVRFCLVDTPTRFIEQAQRNYLWKIGANPERYHLYEQELEEIRQKMTFSDKMSPEEREFTHVVAFDESQIEALKIKIQHSREFLKSIK